MPRNDVYRPTDVSKYDRSTKNLAISSALFRLAYEVKFRQARLKNPELTEKEIHQITLKFFETPLS